MGYYKRQLWEHWGAGHDEDEDHPSPEKNADLEDYYAPNDENEEAYNDYINDQASQLKS